MHYLVVPRVIGLGVSVFCLTFLFNVITTISAYLFMFALDLDLPLSEYAVQLSVNLRALDFLALSVKPLLFGATIGVVACYQGLTRPTRLEHIGGAATNAVVQAIVTITLVNALFIVAFYLL